MDVIRKILDGITARLGGDRRLTQFHVRVTLLLPS